MDEQFDTVVVGGGQAGLAAGYFLAQMGRKFVILDAMHRVGDVWRSRWDSLRLFTPAKFSHLPGMPYPGEDFYFPTKDELADYLETYARKFDLPIRLNSKVDSLLKEDGRYIITSGQQKFLAKNVIVATGGYQIPTVPAFASELDPGIFQLHSSLYKNVEQIPEGGILVVGAGNSGAEIAIELAKHGRTVWLAGNNVGRIPARVLGRILGGRPYWFLISRILSVDTPIGRKIRKKGLHHGTPLIRLKPSDVTDAGVLRLPRLKGTAMGKPQCEDGKILDVNGIVWATGYRSDYSWIKLPIFDEHGLPLHDRGVVQATPGLCFLGLHFQSAVSSGTIGGLERDARHVLRAMPQR